MSCHSSNRGVMWECRTLITREMDLALLQEMFGIFFYWRVPPDLPHINTPDKADDATSLLLMSAWLESLSRRAMNQVDSQQHICMQLSVFKCLTGDLLNFMSPQTLASICTLRLVCYPCCILLAGSIQTRACKAQEVPSPCRAAPLRGLSGPCFSNVLKIL